MGFTVVHEGGTKDSDYREYVRLLSRLLLKRGVSLDRVPLTASNGAGDRRLYVWDSEAEARTFAEQLRQQTEDPGWAVQPVPGEPALGPLHPIEIHVGLGVAYIAFELDPLTRKAIRTRFPGSCRRTGVSIDWDHLENGPPTGEEFHALAAHALSILTGLRPDQLCAFGGYQVVDPVARKVLLGLTPIPC